MGSYRSLSSEKMRINSETHACHVPSPVSGLGDLGP